MEDVDALARRGQRSLKPRAKRLLALEDPVYFAKTYFKDKPLQPFQEDWLRAIADVDKSLVNLTAAVGHGKSHVLSIVYPLWRVCRDPNHRILFISKAENLARLTISTLKDILKTDEDIVRDFGPFYHPGLVWSDSEARVLRTDKTSRDPTFKAIGARGSIEGFRPKEIIIDDLTDLEVEISEAKSEFTKRWIDEQAFPRLEPGGTIRIASARWHPRDIPSYFSAKEGCVTIVAPAIDATGKELWPARWPLQRLLAIKSRDGSHAFAGRYLMDPKAIEGNRFKREWFRYFALKDLPPPERLEVVAGVDPALGKDSKADNFAITVMARDRETELTYVVDHVGGIHDLPAQHRIIDALFNQWKPVAIAIEDVHFQWEGYKALRNRLPVTPLKPQGMDKLSRIETLAAHVENGSIVWREDHREIAELIYELLLFPDADHDDRGDSAEIAWRKLNAGSTSRLGKAFRGARW